MKLSEIITIKTRYQRSINLERDANNGAAIEHYILTQTGKEALARIEKAARENKVSAFTITGVYGSGKSAFALLLSAIFNEDTTIQNAAKKVARLSRKFPTAQVTIATAKREPIETTLQNALNTNADPVQFLQEKAETTPQLIILDELGLAIEHARESRQSLNILQRIAEMPVRHSVIIIALLHQSIGAYANADEKQEWQKIQGRFEDIPFAHRTADTLALLAGAMEKRKKGGRLNDNATELTRFTENLQEQSAKWATALKDITAWVGLSATMPFNLYPLHPVSAFLLPALSARYAQNERTLFSFLSSYEPHSLRSFLEERDAEQMPLLMLPQLYDYFLESAGSAGRRGYSRFLEIEERISSLKNAEPEIIAALKSIGALNLAGIPAFKKLAALALSADPSPKTIRQAEKLLDALTEQRILVYRRLADEYRIYEGSDYDIEEAIKNQSLPQNIEQTLQAIFPLSPVVARRHSYKKGVLRYFARAFAATDFFPTPTEEADGTLYITLHPETKLPHNPKENANSKKLTLLVCPRDHETVRGIATEYIALHGVSADPALQADRVARNEVAKRLQLAREALLSELESRFLDTENVIVLLSNTAGPVPANFNEWLSAELDAAFPKSPVLWNELIHRNKLSTQAARARRMLADAMVAHYGSENFQMEGNGPEATIRESLFIRSGLYQEKNGEWIFVIPRKKQDAHNDLTPLFQEMLAILKQAAEAPVPVTTIYQRLKMPPYGARDGILPLLFLAALSGMRDSVSLYERGTFIPEIKSSHIELLLKRPEFFSVRYFEIQEIHNLYFNTLLQIFKKEAKASIVATIKPFIRFYSSLTNYAKQTNNISQIAAQIRQALANAREPEELLFRSLPLAAGIELSKNTSPSELETLKKRIHAGLLELQEAFPALLQRIQKRFFTAFGYTEKPNEKESLSEFRSIFTGQATQLLSSRILNPEVNALSRTMSETKGSDQEWIARAAMVVADKPAENWKDADIEPFEIKLSETASAFRRLHFLLNKPSQKSAGFESTLITITKPNGEESKEIISLEKSMEKEIQQHLEKIEQILQNTSSPAAAKKALLLKLAKEIIQPQTRIQSEISKATAKEIENREEKIL